MCDIARVATSRMRARDCRAAPVHFAPRRVAFGRARKFVRILRTLHSSEMNRGCTRVVNRVPRVRVITYKCD